MKIHFLISLNDFLLFEHGESIELIKCAFLMFFKVEPINIHVIQFLIDVQDNDKSNMR